MKMKSGVFHELDNEDLGACAHFHNLLPTNVTNHCIIIEYNVNITKLLFHDNNIYSWKMLEQS